jgi:hypothetical protein
MTNKNILFHQNLLVLMLIYLFFNLYASCPICPIKRERERCWEEYQIKVLVLGPKANK